MLRSLGVLAAAPAAGCTAAFGGSAGDGGSSPTPDGGSCRPYAYSPDGTGEGPIPWDVRVTNISVSVYPVRVTITDRDERETVASCTVSSLDHRKLAFDLSTERRYTYEFDAEGLGSESRAFRGLGDDEEFVVTVEDGEYTVRRMHTDTGRTPTGTATETEG